ncbi:MAG: hypothetical protein OES79_13565, partial [Planctomycetota bacterium]|nr:hypothetical protein [Planctomycetota bacterium]
MSTEADQARTSNLEYRVDARHPAARPTADRADQPATAGATVPAIPDLQQVRNHASQLATHLQAMRQDVDRRESEVNARTADADKEMRAARLWLQERHEELEQRAAELDQRERAVSQSEAALAGVVGQQQVAAADDFQLSNKVTVAVRELQQQRQRQESEL